MYNIRCGYVAQWTKPPVWPLTFPWDDKNWYVFVNNNHTTSVFTARMINYVYMLSSPRSSSVLCLWSVGSACESAVVVWVASLMGLPVTEMPIECTDRERSFSKRCQQTYKLSTSITTAWCGTTYFGSILIISNFWFCTNSDLYFTLNIKLYFHYFHINLVSKYSCIIKA